MYWRCYLLPFVCCFSRRSSMFIPGSGTCLLGCWRIPFLSVDFPSIGFVPNRWFNEFGCKESSTTQIVLSKWSSLRSFGRCISTIPPFMFELHNKDEPMTVQWVRLSILPIKLLETNKRLFRSWTNGLVDGKSLPCTIFSTCFINRSYGVQLSPPWKKTSAEWVETIL